MFNVLLPNNMEKAYLSSNYSDAAVCTLTASLMSKIMCPMYTLSTFNADETLNVDA